MATTKSPMKFLSMLFHSIPESTEAKALLKRIFMGKLIPLPYEITEGMANCETRVEIPPDQVNKEYKIIYVVGRKMQGDAG